MTKIELKEGQTISFYYEGVMTFCSCKGLSNIKKEFEFDVDTEGCSFYVNDSYVGRIICQGFRIFDKGGNIIHTEGKNF